MNSQPHQEEQEQHLNRSRARCWDLKNITVTLGFFFFHSFLTLITSLPTLILILTNYNNSSSSSIAFSLTSAFLSLLLLFPLWFSLSPSTYTPRCLSSSTRQHRLWHRLWSSFHLYAWGIQWAAFIAAGIQAAVAIQQMKNDDQKWKDDGLKKLIQGFELSLFVYLVIFSCLYFLLFLFLLVLYSLPFFHAPPLPIQRSKEAVITSETHPIHVDGLEIVIDRKNGKIREEQNGERKEEKEAEDRKPLRTVNDVVSSPDPSSSSSSSSSSPCIRWVGLSILPGRRRGIEFRSLDVDLSRLSAHYRIQVMVTLNEDSELRAQGEGMGLKEMRETAERFGIENLQYQQRDKWIPNDLDSYLDFIGIVAAKVMSGHRCLIHCYGGVGRTGLLCVCVQLYISAFWGESDPNQSLFSWVNGAIQRTRAARKKGMIRNPFQIWYAVEVARRIRQQFSESRDSRSLSTDIRSGNQGTTNT